MVGHCTMCAQQYGTALRTCGERGGGRGREREGEGEREGGREREERKAGEREDPTHEDITTTRSVLHYVPR